MKVYNNVTRARKASMDTAVDEVQRVWTSATSAPERLLLTVNTTETAEVQRVSISHPDVGPTATFSIALGTPATNPLGARTAELPLTATAAELHAALQAAAAANAGADWLPVAYDTV